jgi:thiamine biosynthesis lipoprotein
MTAWRMLAVLLLVARPVASAVTEVHYVMGTYFRITAEGDPSRTAMRGCFQDARRLEETFSRFLGSSELVRVNAGAGAPQPASREFADLLRRTDALRDATEGAFDVTVGPLVELWRRATPPSAAEIEAARAVTGAGRAILRGDVLELAPGTRLDFDGVAKGYAVDRCVERLRAAGVESALVSLGESSLYAIGRPPDDGRWVLAVRGVDPESAVGLLALRNEAASISASLGGRGREGGRSVGHIVDPATGRPLTEEAVAIVVARSATDAEAYSKALLLWGAAGASRVERLGARGAVHLTARAVRQGPRARGRGVFAAFDEPRLLTAAAEPRP